MKPQTRYFLYVIASSLRNKYGCIKAKIGISKNIVRRKREIELQSGENLKLLHYAVFASVESAYSIEKNIHNLLFRQRIKGEWFWLYEIDLTWIKSVKGKQDLLVVAQTKMPKIDLVKSGEIDFPMTAA